MVLYLHYFSQSHKSRTNLFTITKFIRIIDLMEIIKGNVLDY